MLLRQTMAGLAALHGALGLGAAIGEGPGVAGVLQDVQGAMVEQGPPDELALVGSGVHPAREEPALLAEAAHGGRRRSAAAEGLEELGDGLLDGAIGIEHHLARGVVDEPDGQGDLELAAARLGQLAAEEPGPEHVQLRFGHGALHAEQQPVVEVRRVVEAVLVEDQGIGQGADLEEAVPVRGAARQAGHLEPEHHADLAHADGGHEALEASPVRVGPGLTEV